jgi:type II secretory pathway pseudopilin PulG
MAIITILLMGVLIVGAVALYMSFIQKKAYTFEAIVGFRTIRTMEIVYYALNGRYTADWVELGITSGAFANNRWFLSGCFGLTSTSSTDFTAWCNGDNGKEKAKGVYLKYTSHRGKAQVCTLADIIGAKPTYVP